MEEIISDLNKVVLVGNENYEKDLSSYRKVAKTLGAKVSKSGKAVQDALFKNEELAAANKEQAEQLSNEKKKSRDLEEKLLKEISDLKKSLTSPIVSKPVDTNSGKHVRNVIPERIVMTGRSGAQPKVFLVEVLNAEKKNLEETQNAKKAKRPLFLAERAAKSAAPLSSGGAAQLRTECREARKGARLIDALPLTVREQQKK